MTLVMIALSARHRDKISTDCISMCTTKPTKDCLYWSDLHCEYNFSTYLILYCLKGFCIRLFGQWGFYRSSSRHAFSSRPVTGPSTRSVLALWSWSVIRPCCIFDLTFVSRICTAACSSLKRTRLALLRLCLCWSCSSTIRYLCASRLFYCTDSVSIT